MPLTINHVLAQIRAELDLSSATEEDVIAEIRTHLEDAVDAARAAGTSEEVALLKVAEKFGVTEVGKALQDVHLGWESTDAIVATILPVLGALLLRWLVFDPAGTALGWQVVLNRPAFWLVALVMLLLPLLQWRRWRYALIVWGLFWVLSIIFVIFPAASYWQGGGEICVYPCS
ncbi:MAG: hypothetical protein KC443_25300 [Anaerolineales bacterium]|nr:hypothetical protein [Anaerolineales bacterium]MCB8968351.1 hypothetical protein [Ardenticatenaceae bacterium]